MWNFISILKSLICQFQTIVKPSWRPPKKAFGPVWTTLYASMGYASYLVWNASWFSQVSSIIYIFWLKAKKKVQILSYCNLILFLFMFSFKDNWAILYCTKIDLELGLIPVPPFFYLRQFLVRFEGVKGSQNQLYHFSWRYFLFFWFGYVKEFSKKKMFLNRLFPLT